MRKPGLELKTWVGGQNDSDLMTGGWKSNFRPTSRQRGEAHLQPHLGWRGLVLESYSDTVGLEGTDSNLRPGVWRANLSPTLWAKRLASDPYLSKKVNLNPKHTPKPEASLRCPWTGRTIAFSRLRRVAGLTPPLGSIWGGQLQLLLWEHGGNNQTTSQGCSPGL